MLLCHLQIKESFKAQAHLLDFSCMRDGWELKEGPNKDTAEAIKARLARYSSTCFCAFPACVCGDPA
eukprot:1183124-Rhodomonas_salina.1